MFILHAFGFCGRHLWWTLQKQVAQNVSRVTNSMVVTRMDTLKSGLDQRFQ